MKRSATGRPPLYCSTGCRRRVEAARKQLPAARQQARYWAALVADLERLDRAAVPASGPEAS